MKKAGLIRHELVHHLPLTLIGAGISIVAIILLSIFRLLDDVEGISHDIFFILHPGHIILSGIATTSLFLKYGKKKNWDRHIDRILRISRNSHFE